VNEGDRKIALSALGSCQGIDFQSCRDGSLLPGFSRWISAGIPRL